jgi:Ca-activated chloride channel family protein
MLRPYFAHPLALWALTALPVVALLGFWAARCRRRALARLGPSHALAGLLTVRRGPRRWRGLLVVLGLLLLGIGAAGPQWGRDWFQEAVPGRDVVVLLDCSRSMRAGTPSRLQAARQAALDLADALERRGGYRIALVACAANPRLVVPLTLDFGHFRGALDGAEFLPDDPAVRPREGDTSGTRLGRGIEAAVAAHDERFPGARDIVLLSDGDDPVEDAEWLKGTARARAAGIPVHVVGLGDPEEGMTIPSIEGPLQDTTGPVLSRLQEAPLREIARLTQGEYVGARTKQVPLGQLYLDHVVSLPVRQGEADAVPIYRQRQDWFLISAFTLLTLTLVLPDRIRLSRTKEDRT